MKFRDIFKVNHFLEDKIVEGYNEKIFTFVYFFQTFFLSKMLNASAMTIEGIKMMFSPASHFSKISDAVAPILGLYVNHQIRACVSVTKFIKALYFYFAIEGLFY